jgi:ATP-binding cassette subfamily C protein LapB
MGGLIAAYMLSSRAMAPISRTASLLTQYHSSARSLTSLDEIMKKEVERPEGVNYQSHHLFKGEIELRGVSFSYPEQETRALDDVSIHISPGERVAILGKVGSGKSTLGRLLMGLYRPLEGAVLYDGIDMRQLDPSEIRRNLGYVPQDVTLFYGSLKDNIAMGAPRAHEKLIAQAALLGGLDSFINSHPSGLHLQVGERGERLSSGQRQGVAIARALVKGAPILMMDEPTASMDHTTEEMVKKRLALSLQGRTLLLVTHRTSLLALVNRVVVMDGGRVAMDGPRDEVLKALRQGNRKGA